MPTISLNIPPQTALLAVAFGAIAMYAGNAGTVSDVCEDGEKIVTYKKPLFEHIKNVLVADDFVSLRAMFRLKSAIDDILRADFSATDCDMSPSHLKDVFTPVMPEHSRRAFLNMTSNYEKAQKTIKKLRSAGSLMGEGSSPFKNMELFSQFADILPNDAVSSVMKMKDMMSAFAPFMSTGVSTDHGKYEDKCEYKTEPETECEKCEDGGFYSVNGEDVINEDDEEYDSILEIMRMMKNA